MSSSGLRKALINIALVSVPIVLAAPSYIPSLKRISSSAFALSDYYADARHWASQNIIENHQAAGYIFDYISFGLYISLCILLLRASKDTLLDVEQFFGGGAAISISQRLRSALRAIVYSIAFVCLLPMRVWWLAIVLWPVFIISLVVIKYNRSFGGERTGFLHTDAYVTFDRLLVLAILLAIAVLVVSIIAGDAFGFRV